MCIGIPMQIIRQDEFSALCRGGDREEVISTLFIGPQPVDTWVLCSLGTARDVISEDEAQKIQKALDALDLLSRGGEVEVDHYFPDLVRSE